MTEEHIEVERPLLRVEIACLLDDLRGLDPASFGLDFDANALASRLQALVANPMITPLKLRNVRDQLQEMWDRLIDWEEYYTNFDVAISDVIEVATPVSDEE